MNEKNINDSIALNLKLRKLFNDLWNEKFPNLPDNEKFPNLPDNEKFPNLPDNERYTTNEDETVNLFVERLRFCDDFKPKFINSSNITLSDTIRIQIADTIKIELHKDIVSSGLEKKITEKYLVSK